MLRNTARVVVVLLCLSAALAAQRTTPSGSRRVAPNRTLGEVIRNGGEIGYVIIALSVIGVSLAIEHAMHLRREKLAPSTLVSEVTALVVGDKLQEALDLCEAKPGFYSNVVAAALPKLSHGFESMEQAAKDMAEEESIRLHSKISYLSLISSVSPMLGLLGTVVGMVGAFNTIAEKESPEPADFAKDISVALITTVFGLIVAIPASATFFYFRNRVVRISIEIGALVEDLLDRFRPHAKE